MSHDEAKRLVQLGLDHRREEKEREAQELRLEAYEKEMIRSCNDHCADARDTRRAETQRAEELAMRETQRMELRKQMIQRRQEEQARMRAEMERDIAAQESVRRYLMGCLVMMLVTVWTPLPWWAAAATIFGTAVIEGAYVFRLYYPAK